MAIRKDGVRTKERILTVACEVFAEKGYHDATVEEICKRAETNIAAVNYHFGSKEQLYAEVWRHAFDLANKAYPLEGGLGPDAQPEERLRGTIYSVVGRTVNPGRVGDAGKLLLRELVNPTDVLEDVKRDALRPFHDKMNLLMEQLLGPGASREQILLCEMSVMHQCMAFGIRLFMGKIPPHLRLDMPVGELVETLAGHITRFSLAGIQAVRAQIEGAE
jgi:AcrR family transcriptional regulator